MRAAVAGGHPATVAAGVEILEDGGNAADAAVASALAACVAETVMTGLLGGGHAIYFDAASGRVRNLDCFVAVPGLGVEPRTPELIHLDIPFGALRLKRGGGDNGHNGLRSVSSALGSKDYLRVRFGIGRPPGRQDPADFVLKDFSAAERKELPFLVDRAADAVEALLTGPLEAAQNTFHVDA